eukprot:UN28026
MANLRNKSNTKKEAKIEKKSKPTNFEDFMANLLNKQKKTINKPQKKKEPEMESEDDEGDCTIVKAVVKKRRSKKKTTKSFKATTTKNKKRTTKKSEFRLCGTLNYEIYLI